MTTQAMPDQVLEFWFGNNVLSQIPVQKVLHWFPDVSDENYLQQHNAWLSYIEEHYLFLIRSAMQAGLQEWQATPRHCLALILLLDQMAPLFFHGHEQQRVSSDLALAYCRYGMTQRFTKHLTPVELCFFYGPLLHADKFAPRSIGLKMLQQLVQEVRFTENPYHQQRGQVLHCFYQALKQHAQRERELLQASA